MEKYYIDNDTIIFNYEFNEPLDKYIEIIKNYKKLIFSDYDDYKICIETNNKWILEYDSHYKHSKFNRPLTNSLDGLNMLTQLTFGTYFNQPVEGCFDNLKSLTHLTFGVCFNQPVDKGCLNNLKNLTQLTFGYWFNQPVDEGCLDNLNNLTQLTFGDEFNQPIESVLDNLKNLTILTLGYKFNQELAIPINIKILKLNNNNRIIDYLPNSIEGLFLGQYFNLELDNLPNSIKIILFDKDSKYNKELNNLPKSLSKLYLPKKYDKEIINIDQKCVISKKVD